MHELDRGGREILALLLDGIVDRQQFIEAEGGAHGRHAGPRGRRTRDVVQQVVEQLDRRVLRIAHFAQFVQAPDLAIGEAQQALDRHTALGAVLAQGLEQRAHHPPELEHALLGRHLLQSRRHGRQDLEVLLQPLAPDPADQARLEARTEPARPLCRRERRLARRRRGRLRLTVRLQVEQQQRAFRKQGTAAHRAQIIQQRQQHQREIAPAGEHALQVAGELDHGAHQRVEGLGTVLALAGCRQQVTRHLLHLFGQQRGAVDFEHAQRTLNLVQLEAATLQQRLIVGLLDVRLQCTARIAKGNTDLAGRSLHGLGGEFGHLRGVPITWRPKSSGVAASQSG